VYGGPVPARRDARGATIPVKPVHRVRLDGCEPALAPPFRLRGVVHLDADGRSLLAGALRNTLAVLIRESGF
jgi:hypothetical protein